MLKDRYVLSTVLGSGGMGKVYLAFDKKLDKYWAIKEILKNKAGSELLKESIEAEFEALKNLDHRGLPRIVDYINESDRVYIVMDYVKGENLADYLKQNGCLKNNLAIDVAIELAEIIDYLHKQKNPIIYRDLKPANIIIAKDGTIKLIDFGASRRLSEISVSYMLGTKGTAAPEMYNNIADERSDIYAFGKTMQFCIGNNKSSIRKILKKCCHYNPQKRYQDMEKLILDLKAQKKKLFTFGSYHKIIYILTIIFFLLLGLIVTNQYRKNNMIYEEKMVEATVLEKNPENVVSEIKRLHEEAKKYIVGENYSQVSLGKAMSLLIEAKKLIEDNSGEELVEFRVENLSMLSTIYKLLGKQNENEREDYYKMASECIEELFSINSVRESSLYSLKLSDLVSMKNEIGEKELALKYLKEYEKEGTHVDKEIYFQHAFILLEDKGNYNELLQLYNQMKTVDELKRDYRYEGLEKQIANYLRGEENIDKKITDK